MKFQALAALAIDALNQRQPSVEHSSEDSESETGLGDDGKVLFYFVLDPHRCEYELPWFLFV